jgi:SAM-dependent methyltransferase
MSGATRRDCPACGSRQLDEVIRLDQVPVHSMILLDDAAAARSFPRAALHLVHCTDCGFLFNAAFDPSHLRYEAAFEESQHFSATFGRFAAELVEELAADGVLADRHVVEIGCGRGEFLAALCRRSGCRATGIDPGWRAGRLKEPLPAGLHFLAEPLSARHRSLGADLLLCRHTLEHIDEVADFVALAASLGSRRPDFRLVFETPDAGRIMAEGAFWDLYYEHCSYFTAAAKRRLFARAGLAVTRLERVFDGQYLLLEAQPSDRPPEPPAPPTHGLAARLAARLAERIAQCRSAIARWTGTDRLVLWGGGSKAVAFLTALDLGEEVAAVVDINPFRQGHFLPGSGHRIVAPEELRDIRPDRVLVMNPVYRGEVAATLASLDLKAALETLA